MIIKVKKIGILSCKTFDVVAAKHVNVVSGHSLNFWNWTVYRAVSEHGKIQGTRSEG